MTVTPFAIGPFKRRQAFFDKKNNEMAKPPHEKIISRKAKKYNKNIKISNDL
jgi:hypothetical protein